MTARRNIYGPLSEILMVRLDRPLREDLEKLALKEQAPAAQLARKAIRSFVSKAKGKAKP